MLLKILRNRAGIAAVEFALLSPVLFTVVGGLVDFSLALYQHSLIETGVANGATYAFQQAQADVSQGTSVSAATVKSVIQDAINLSNVSVTVSSPALECITYDTASTPPTVTLASAQAGTKCSDGNLPGTWLTATATYTYVPMMPVYSHLANTTFTETANVRLY